MVQFLKTNTMVYVKRSFKVIWRSFKVIWSYFQSFCWVMVHYEQINSYKCWTIFDAFFSKKVIQGHSRSSKVIQGYPMSSKVIQGHLKAIQGHLMVILVIYSAINHFKEEKIPLRYRFFLFKWKCFSHPPGGGSFT